MATIRKRLTENAERVNPVQPVHIWHTPAGAAVDMLIVTHLSVYSTIHEHGTASLPNETGGFLVGRVSFDHRDGSWHLEIEEAVPVAPETQDPVHFTFTWRDVDRVRTYREEHGKALIGWYHTHPDIGIFLSETDLERTHRVLFSDPFQLALVYDPVRGRAGYFFWEGAQTIDASVSPWREFEIAVALEPERETLKAREPDTTRMVSPGPLSLEPAEVRAADAAGLSETHFRRLRAIEVEPEGDPSSGRASAASTAESPLSPPADGIAPQVRRGTEVAAPTVQIVSAPSTRLWRSVAVGILLLLAGVAVGYFWLGAGRGPQ